MGRGQKKKMMTSTAPNSTLSSIASPLFDVRTSSVAGTSSAIPSTEQTPLDSRKMIVSCF